MQDYILFAEFFYLYKYLEKNGDIYQLYVSKKKEKGIMITTITTPTRQLNSG
jgi:hypothetical protein